MGLVCLCFWPSLCSCCFAEVASAQMPCNSRTRIGRRSGAFGEQPVRHLVSDLGNFRTRTRKRKRTDQTIKLPAATIGLPLPAESLKLPAPHYCHHYGDIEIAVNEYPPELARLFTSQEEDAVHFRKYARLYNNSFAFSSLGGNFDASKYKGVYVFKLHGQLYHFVAVLLPGDDQPKYLQLYFYDGKHEAENRVGSFPEIREDIIAILMRISENNPYARFFRSLREVEVTEETQIILNQNAVPDQHVYNAPTTDEVAGIWPESASSSHSASPHIMVSGKSNVSHRIYHHYECYDPLQYPGLKKKSCGGRQQLATQVDPVLSCSVHNAEDLLDAEASRASGKRTKADRYISSREYYAFLLQMRAGNMLLRAGRLLQ